MPIIHSYIIFCAGSVRIFFFLKSLFWHRERECEHTNGEQLAEGAGEAASLQTRLAFLRNICYSQATKLFSVFFSELYGFSFYVCIYDLSWVTFCVWCEVGVKAHFFFFSYLVIQLFQPHLLKRFFSSPWIALTPLSNTKWLNKCESLFSSLFCPLIYWLILIMVPGYVD